MQVVLFQVARLEIPLHGEHFGHAVGDGRTRGEHNPSPAIEGLDMAHLQVHIEGPFAGGLRQAGNARHLGDVEQILKIVCLVHEHPIHAEFLESQRVVFFVFSGERLQTGHQTFLGAFKLLYKATIRCARVFPANHLQLVQLFLEEPALRILGEGNPLEAGVRDDDGIPIPGGDPAEKFLPVL